METLIGKYLSSKEYREVIQMWKGNCSAKDMLDNGGTSLSPAVQNLLSQSPCVTWILDVRTQKFDFITKNTIDFFGYESERFLSDGHSFHERIKHPDDSLNTWKLVYSIWNALTGIPSGSRPNYKFSYDYRILKPDGRIVRILEQNAVLHQDTNGNITHLLGVCNDITPWKKTGSQLASLTSTVDQKFYLFHSENTSAIKPKSILSKRELEILKLMADGRSSKLIADQLFISFHTVNTHRQKMIEKTNTRNTGGLIQFAIFNGLI
jgi:DNA-binding CsgD family transcriptional regulator